MKKILKFYSPTCGPCKIMSKVLSTLEGVEIKDIDITRDENEELVEQYKIRSIPTITILDENNEVVKSFTVVVLIYVEMLEKYKDRKR